MTEPTFVYAGDTVTWAKSLSQYPAPTWVLSYSLVRDGGAYTITATPSGTDHAVSVPAATTAEWLPATYRWVSYVSNGTNRHTLDTGDIEIRPNPMAGGYDARTYARRVLEAIESVIEGRATTDVSSYSVAGRSVSKMSMAELLAARSQMLREVEREKAKERIARGLGSGRKILTRM